MSGQPVNRSGGLSLDNFIKAARQAGPKNKDSNLQISKDGASVMVVKNASGLTRALTMVSRSILKMFGIENSLLGPKSNYGRQAMAAEVFQNLVAKLGEKQNQGNVDLADFLETENQFVTVGDVMELAKNESLAGAASKPAANLEQKLK